MKTLTDEQVSTAAADIERACVDVNTRQAAGEPYERQWAKVYTRAVAMEAGVPPEQLKRVLLLEGRI